MVRYIFRHSIICIAILSLIWQEQNVNARIVRIKGNSSLQSQLKFAKSTYIFSETYDLNGSSLLVPESCILKFQKGSRITNGRIEGNHTQISAGQTLVFSNVRIVGTWNNSEVHSRWFPLKEQEDNTENIQSIMALCSGEKLTDLYFQKGEYFVRAFKESAPIIVPSNTYWHNEGTFQLLPTSLTKYNLVLISKVNNVTIDGGRFVGDLVSHLGQEGEWGHGIKCGGAKQIVLKNLTCEYFWGDGIDLIEGRDKNGQPSICCDSILIDNVKCLYNRRQGLSIEAAFNVVVRNSEFAYTGQEKFTSPGGGIDIEPWAKNGEKVKFISIFNCNCHDNKGFDFYCEANFQDRDNYTRYYNNILVDNCNIGRMRVLYSNGVVIRNCNFFNRLHVEKSDNIEVISSSINRYTYRDIGKHVRIEKAK